MIYIFENCSLEGYYFGHGDRSEELLRLSSSSPCGISPLQLSRAPPLPVRLADCPSSRRTSALQPSRASPPPVYSVPRRLPIYSPTSSIAPWRFSTSSRASFSRRLSSFLGCSTTSPRPLPRRRSTISPDPTTSPAPPHKCSCDVNFSKSKEHMEIG